MEHTATALVTGSSRGIGRGIGRASAEEFGGLDILVNNAATQTTCAFAELDEAD